MTPLQARLHQERKARLARMHGWQANIPIVKAEIPKTEELPPKVVKLEDLTPKKPPKFDGWFWPAIPVDPDKLKINHVLKVVCAYYRIVPRDVLSDDRHAWIVRPRMVVCYLARELTRSSWNKIGKVIHKDHTSALHAWQKLSKTAAEDKEIQELLQLIRRYWHENAQGQPDQDQQGGQVCNGLQRPQPGGQPDSASVSGP